MKTVYYTETYPKRRMWKKEVEIKGESVVETSWKCIQTWEVVDNNPRLSTEKGRRKLVSYAIDKAPQYQTAKSMRCIILKKNKR